jgi:predicted dehydrogenase
MLSKLREVRVGVVGTGVMGGHHARVAASLPGSALVGIYDPATERARQVAADYETTAFATLKDLCAEVEAIVVASPTVTHGEIASKCLEAGLHVLLEKPIAATVRDAQDLVALSEQVGKFLMIGHVERFNPAVMTARSMLNSAEIFDCSLQRLSTVSGRDRSVDIVLDLMIHDIDLALAFTGAAVTSVVATGHKIGGELIDHVTALLRFDNGATATLAASAVSQARVRVGHFHTPTELFTVDFASRELTIRRGGRSTLAQENVRYVTESQVEQVLVPNQEPLALEQTHFLESIRNGTQPEPNGKGGLAALRVACDVQAMVMGQLAG